MINVVACTCAEPSNPPFNKKCLIFLTDVTKHVFITFDSLLTQDSTFMIKRGTYSPPGRIQQGFILYTIYLSNRPQVSVVYKLINHAGCW